MFCGHCGEKAIEDNSFCTECGKKIEFKKSTTSFSEKQSIPTVDALSMEEVKMEDCQDCLNNRVTEIGHCITCKKPIGSSSELLKKINRLQKMKKIRNVAIFATIVIFLISLLFPVEFTRVRREVQVESFAQYTQDTRPGQFVEVNVVEIVDAFEITTRRTGGVPGGTQHTRSYYLFLSDMGTYGVLSHLDDELNNLLLGQFLLDETVPVRVIGRTYELPEITSTVPLVDIQEMLDVLDVDNPEAFGEAMFGTDEERRQRRELAAILETIRSFISVGRDVEIITERIPVSGNVFMRNLTRSSALGFLVLSVIMFFFVKIYNSIVKDDIEMELRAKEREIFALKKKREKD